MSAGGGSQPRWSGPGKGPFELFYISADSRLVRVSVTTAANGQDVSIGQPVPLFSMPLTGAVHGGTSFEYDVSADGLRFLVDAFVEWPNTPISLILNRRPLPR